MTIRTNTKNQSTTWVIDLVGRFDRKVYPNDTLGWQYLDAQRKVIQTRPGGITQTSTNDSLGRNASLINPLGTFTPGYDGDTSRLLQVIHSGGFDTAFTHYGPERDRALHTITSKLPGGSQIGKHTYGYNDQDQINSWKRESSLANPSGPTRSFEWSSYYDFSSQLTSVAEKSLAGVLQGGWDYGHDQAGNITSTQTSTAASSSVALTKRTHNSLNQIATTGGGGSTLIRGTLSESGQVSVGMTGSGDKPARMLEGNRFETELPLQVGINSVSIAASDFSANRSNYQFNLNVAAQSPTSPSYDNEGNLLSDGTRSYDWDTFSRLKKITWASGKTTEFIYNSLGQRSERIDTVSGVITKYYYIYDGIQLIERRTGTNASTATADRRYFSQGEQRKNGSNWENYFYCRDHLGSIREVVKSVGSTNTLVARYDYAPYGQRLTQYQAPGYTCDFGYTGHITLPSLVTDQAEMVLTHFRAYDPMLCRWLSVDPIGEAGGLNLYGYVANNPLMFHDPFGLEPLCPFDPSDKIGGMKTSEVREIEKLIFEMNRQHSGGNRLFDITVSPNAVTVDEAYDLSKKSHVVIILSHGTVDARGWPMLKFRDASTNTSGLRNLAKSKGIDFTVAACGNTRDGYVNGTPNKPAEWSAASWGVETVNKLKALENFRRADGLPLVINIIQGPR